MQRIMFHSWHVMLWLSLMQVVLGNPWVLQHTLPLSDVLFICLYIALFGGIILFAGLLVHSLIYFLVLKWRPVAKWWAYYLLTGLAMLALTCNVYLLSKT